MAEKQYYRITVVLQPQATTYHCLEYVLQIAVNMSCWIIGYFGIDQAECESNNCCWKEAEVEVRNVMAQE